jgi:uracil-DNA glycosylase
MVTGPHCESCPQQPYGQALVTFNGTSTSGIMCVGESPWYDEIAAGTPFAGAAGSVFDRLLQRVDLDRRDVIVTNSAWCKAPRLGFYDSRDPNAAMAMAQCRPYLDALIDRMKPKVLVPMGNVALRRVCGVSGIESYAGYVLDTVYGIPAVPTFHPSYIMQGNQKLSPVVIYALDRAKEISRHGFVRPNYNLMLDPSVGDLTVYVRDKLLGMGGSIPSLFIDLETPESANLDEEEVDEKGKSWQIIRASFAIEDGVAVSFPWTPVFTGILQELLDRSDETVEWATNHFDTRRLAAAGLRLPKRCVSALWAWHWLQSDLRKGLEYVAPFFGACTPWKHKNISDPAYYSAMDSLEGRRCYQGTMAALKAYGRWDSFERHCTQADPILQTMGRTGILIDPAERESFMSTLKSEHDADFAELQGLVPDAIKNVKYWKRPPKDMSGVIALTASIGATKDVLPLPPKVMNQVLFDGGCHSLGLKDGQDFPTQRLKLLGDRSSTVTEVLTDAAQDVGSDADVSHALGTVNLVQGPGFAHTLPIAAGYKYVKVLPFLPSSWEQVQKLATHLKVKLPKKRDAEDDDDVSTEDKFLAAPSRKHREFYLVRSCRKSSKLLTTYQWPLNEHGRATTIFGWGPSTLRKDSRSVNLMNVPKRSKLAKKFRRMIVAAPGHLLVEADAQAIEAVLVGWFAGSPRYIKLAKAGVHGWLTAAYHSKVYALDDPDLPQLCSESKLQWPDDYEKCKRVVHLSNYKGTPIRIAEEYPEEFPTVAAARKLQSFYFETEPGQDIRRWQDKVCLQAAHDCYLENPFKYRHWLYSVSQWDRRRECYVAGDDAKRAIAFLPQSTASACQSEVLLRLAQDARMRSWLRLIIHDSFLCEPPEGDALACAAMLRDEMLMPISELGGLQIGVEVSIGHNWGEMHKV